jgi:hypothetical protein
MAVSLMASLVLDLTLIERLSVRVNRSILIILVACSPPVHILRIGFGGVDRAWHIKERRPMREEAL